MNILPRSNPLRAQPVAVDLNNGVLVNYGTVGEIMFVPQSVMLICLHVTSMLLDDSDTTPLELILMSIVKQTLAYDFTRRRDKSIPEGDSCRPTRFGRHTTEYYSIDKSWNWRGGGEEAARLFDVSTRFVMCATLGWSGNPGR